MGSLDYNPALWCFFRSFVSIFSVTGEGLYFTNFDVFVFNSHPYPISHYPKNYVLDEHAHCLGSSSSTI